MISKRFQIHLLSELVTVFRTPVLFGIEWTDDDLSLSTIIGHEMCHAFQNTVVPLQDDHRLSGALTEGTARMSETLHSYSHTSHVRTSLVYDPTINGCNGDLAQSAAVQSGPATNRLYNSCAFWLAWYGRHGMPGLVALFGALDTNATAEDAWTEMRGAIEEATGAPVEEDLAHFAGAIITRRGFVWAPATGGDPIDWSQYLEQWYPPVLELDEVSGSFLNDGAMLGHEITSGGTITLSTDVPVGLYEIRDTGSATFVTPIASGATIAPPGVDEHAYVVAIQLDAEAADVALTLTP